MLVSPLLVVPLFFHCVTAVRRRPVQRRIYSDFSQRGAVFGMCGHHYCGINFNGRSFTDADLPLLRHFPDLDHLDLSGTAVSDAAVPWLTRLKKLRLLTLRHTHVTPEGISKLQRALPKCKIFA